MSAFSTDAKPTLLQRCVSCHGGNNAMATNALDMTNVGNAGAQDAACAQVKNKIDPTTPSMSGIFLQVDPSGNAIHPFKFPDRNTFQTYQTMATKWISQER